MFLDAALLRSSVLDLRESGDQRNETTCERTHSEHQRGPRASLPVQEMIDASIRDHGVFAIVGMNRDLRVTVWNAGAERMYGYTTEEMIGQRFQVLIAPERDRADRAIMSRVLAGDTVDHFETVRLCKDGRRLDVSVGASAVHDLSGRIIGVLSIASDVGETKALVWIQDHVIKRLLLAAELREEALSQEIVGYPSGLSGDAGRIAAAADASGALTSDRAYRPEFTDVEAREMMRAGSGTQFDVGILEVLLQVLDTERRLGEPDTALDPGQDANGRDRAAAIHDRGRAKVDLRRPPIDLVTGAFEGELGLIALDREIKRARRGGGRLVLACVDVDGLKAVNDNEGHTAGDQVLRHVVMAIRAHLRAYDPVVRVGGDEFVCALGDSVTKDACARFQAVAATIERTWPDTSISVGFAELRPGDTLEQLTKRGDKALYEAKHAS
jgi:diguanylate cyclase (GGDEF)-like protein/PAS domain S-box-containing protein